MPATTLEEEPQDLKAECYDVEMDISGAGSAAGSNKPTTTTSSSNNSMHTEEEEIKNPELGGGGYYSANKGKKVQLEWHIEQYAVKVKGGEKVILKNIVGKAETGTFSGVLGPSGCGKSSLLDCLALRNRHFTGTLRLDDKPLDGEFFLNTGYVHQKELFFSHMTVREHLTFHAINRLSRMLGKEECLQRVEEVMAEVDLGKVADSKIGGGDLYFSKGLSGGEHKRLNIATELLADPSILLLDEPTSGLDSVMGEMICLLLHELAVRDPQRIIIAVVHSPSSRLFTLFNNVSLLSSDGQLAYFGRRKHLLPFLEGLGYHCPARFNPADFILELASTKIVQGYAPEGVTLRPDKASKQLTGVSMVRDGSERTLPTVAPSLITRDGTGNTSSSKGNMSELTCNNEATETGSVCSIEENKRNLVLLMLSDSSPKLVEAMDTQESVQELRSRLGADNHHHDVLTVKGARSSLWTIFKMNLWRGWIQESREKAGNIVRLIMNILLGFIFGVLYYNQIPNDNGRNTAGFLFSLSVTMLIASGVSVCLHFPFDFAILMREYYTGANTPGAYFLGRTLAAAPISLMFLMIGIIPYGMVGLAPDPAAFCWFVLILFLTNFGSQSLAYVASSCTSNPVVAISILPLLITPAILFSSMLIQKSTVPASLSWLQSMSIVNYAYSLLVLNQVDKVGGAVQTFMLNFLEIKPSQFNVFIVDLAALALGYRLLAMLVLFVRVRFISKPA